jgi:hypothetical protein
MIESRAYGRLRQLRDRLLWDGRAPVPVDHVLEQILGLSISYEIVSEEPGERILGCIRPERREVVLNEKYADLFTRQPGVERFTMAHEAGHADVFSAAASATEQAALFESPPYRPLQRSAAKGPVNVLAGRLVERIARYSRDERTTAMVRFRDLEILPISEGQDTPLVRRAVDHYAATLLMPEDLLKEALQGSDASLESTVRHLARRFRVSNSAMRIRLQEIGAARGASDSASIALQGTLF